jgi:ABC-type nitrate/sulfonate/bicarbonate transport system ATPase subunit
MKGYPIPFVKPQRHSRPYEMMFQNGVVYPWMTVAPNIRSQAYTCKQLLSGMSVAVSPCKSAAFDLDQALTAFLSCGRAAQVAISGMNDGDVLGEMCLGSM